MTRLLVWGIATLVVLGGADSLPAQDHVLQELYGRGVHAYFSKDYTAAYENLSSAIDQGSRDPRCYYFRGLALEHTGRSADAVADFKRGAEIELTSDEQLYDVSRSLQRVQGPERIKLEESRQVVRVELRKRKLEYERARYEAFKRAEERVIRKPRPAFEAEAPAGGAPAKPSTKPAADDPFGAPPPKPPKPAAEDPFGEPAKPAAPAKPGKPAADDDPFAEAPPKPAGKPAPPPKPAAEDDPFGDDAPPPKPPAGKPAPPKPAPKPADDDPFGT